MVSRAARANGTREGKQSDGEETGYLFHEVRTGLKSLFSAAPSRLHSVQALREAEGTEPAQQRERHGRNSAFWISPVVSFIPA